MRLQRTIAIIMLLLQREKITAKELAERFEVSLRTIYRDVDNISAAGIPIMGISGVGGGLCIMKEYKVEKGIFSATDLASMLMGLKFLSKTLSDEHINITLEKMRSYIPEKQSQDVLEHINQVSFDMTAWIGDSKTEQSKVKSIHFALKHRRTLTFDYHGRDGESSRRTVEPYHLVFKEQVWYLQGYCLGKNDFRNFKCLKISNMLINQDVFTARDVPQVFDDFISQMSQKMIFIKLRVQAPILDQILRYCSEDSIVKEAQGSYLIDFGFIEDNYGYGILMSFGDLCECLEPAHVRSELARKFQKASALYG